MNTSCSWLHVLKEGSEGGPVQGNSEVLPAVETLLGLDELVVPELCELGSQRKVASNKKLFLASGKLRNANDNDCNAVQEQIFISI